MDAFKIKIFKFVTGLDEEQTKKMLLIFLAVAIFIFSMVFQVIYEELKAKRGHDPNRVSPKMEFEMANMTRDYPIAKMVPYIAQKDKTVAAFMVSIAKKESNWGKRVPVKNGNDCYNYWGFRMQTDFMGSGGHTCFRSPQQAVNIVSDRLNELVKIDKRDTPAKMAIWKCGSACAYDRQVGKWVDDVNLYFSKLINL